MRKALLRIHIARRHAVAAGAAAADAAVAITQIISTNSYVYISRGDVRTLGPLLSSLIILRTKITSDDSGPGAVLACGVRPGCGCVGTDGEAGDGAFAEGVGEGEGREEGEGEEMHFERLVALVGCGVAW